MQLGLVQGGDRGKGTHGCVRARPGGCGAAPTETGAVPTVGTRGGGLGLLSTFAGVVLVRWGGGRRELQLS